MRPPSQRRFIAFALVSGLALGVAGTVGAYSLRATPTAPTGVSSVERASLERLLANVTVKPTGETRRFDLTVTKAAWELLPGLATEAITFNGTVPGPAIRVTEGDTVEVVVRNALAEATSVHWHGLHVPNDQDGVAGITQPPIAPGATFTYRFTAPHAGTFMYHAHGPNSRGQIDQGLYAPFIIDPQGADPIAADREYVLAIGNWMVGAGMAGMDAMGMAYDYFTINGKSYPATAPIDVTEGDLVRLRFINPSQTIHPMHLHGTDMAVVAKDGERLAAPQRLNTLSILPGETYDVVFRADNPGAWLLHCHDLHHASNNGQEPGGLIVVVNVRAKGGTSSPAPAGSTSPSPSQVPGHTMAPDMTAMPGMSSMPGMTH
ncbi:MAG: multicopper oxidase domain-containing protein [Chloroflexi bacterium]|nr:multicopper oxidase domain-containing protein [Chloroflexota bacterium]